jgi:hypothetical protein
MADETPRRGRELMGQPLWIWGAGAVALVGGYVYLRRKGQAAGAAAAQPASTSGTYTSPTGMSWEQFLLFLHDQQSSSSTTTVTTTSGPKPKPKPAPKPVMHWSGALGKWMTGAQWHQWHVQHLAHQKKAG